MLIFFNPQIFYIECSDEALLYQYSVGIFNPWRPPGILDFKYLTLNALKRHYYINIVLIFFNPWSPSRILHKYLTLNAQTRHYYINIELIFFNPRSPPGILDFK